MSSKLQTSVFLVNLLRQFPFHQKHRRSHNDIDVRHIWEIGVRATRCDQRNENNQPWRPMEWELLTMKIFQWWTCHKDFPIYNVFGLMNENLQSINALGDRLTWFKSSLEYRDLYRLDGESMEFEWNIHTRFPTLQSFHKVSEKFTGRIIFMSMFNRLWWSKDNQKECESNAQFANLQGKRFEAGKW